MPALPLLAVGSLLAVLPLLMYIPFAAEFSELWPLWPPHYIYLCRRFGRASKSSNMKARPLAPAPAVSCRAAPAPAPPPACCVPPAPDLVGPAAPDLARYGVLQVGAKDL